MRLIRISVVFATLILAGCQAIPTAQIEAFGNESKAVSSQVTAVINEVYDARLNKEIEVAINQGGAINTKASLKVFDRHLFKTAKDKKMVSLYTASRALTQYFNAIHQLAQAGDKSTHAMLGVELANALQNINNADKQLNGDGQRVSEERAIQLGASVGAVSYLLAKNEAVKALREIVTSADEAVSKLSSAMDKTLSEGAIAQQLYAYRSEHLVSSLLDYSEKERQMSMADRRAQLNGILQEYTQVTMTSETISKARSAIRALARAHKKLAQALEKQEYTSANITKAVKSLRQEKAYFTSLRDAWLACESDQLVLTNSKTVICQPNE